MRTHYCSDLNPSLNEQIVTLCGWAHRRRDHGGVIFIDLRDRSGLAQVVCDPDRAEMFNIAESVRGEFCLKITGKVRPRPAGTENTTLASGAIEVLCHDIEVLNPSVTPPFQVDDEHLSETVRLTHRVMDLRRPAMQKNLQLRYRVARAFRRYLDDNGFIDIETPMLTKSTPEGARDYLVPSRVHDGQFFALPQSPQLFKQLLMVAGFDRYYQIVKCFRDEDLRADRQPEFTQVDIETSFLSEEEIMGLMEGLIRYVFKDALDVDLPNPFPRMAYAEAMARFGSRWPMIFWAAMSAVTAMGLKVVNITATPDTFLWGLGFHGLFVTALQCAMFALCAHIYPTTIRTTGAASAMADASAGASWGVRRSHTISPPMGAMRSPITRSVLAMSRSLWPRSRLSRQ